MARVHTRPLLLSDSRPARALLGRRVDTASEVSGPTNSWENHLTICTWGKSTSLQRSVRRIKALSLGRYESNKAGAWPTLLLKHKAALCQRSISLHLLQKYRPCLIQALVSCILVVQSGIELASALQTKGHNRSPKSPVQAI